VAGVRLIEADKVAGAFHEVRLKLTIEAEVDR
jgi:hypothetical protein